VECIGKGNAHKPYKFGVNVSVATTLKHSKGGQFVVRAQALPGNPNDGHTLAGAIPASSNSSAIRSNGSHADAGYRGHNAPPRLQVQNLYIQAKEQKRRVPHRSNER
jgi:IS5 family transposase